jgi:hypothetical protein
MATELLTEAGLRHRRGAGRLNTIEVDMPMCAETLYDRTTANGCPVELTGCPFVCAC